MADLGAGRGVRANPQASDRGRVRRAAPGAPAAGRSRSYPFGGERLAQRGEHNVPCRVDDPVMTFLLKQWRWRLSPAGRRARKANAERVALLTSTKRTA